MPGLEPGTNDPESFVLPITPHPSVENFSRLLYYKNRNMGTGLYKSLRNNC